MKSFKLNLDMNMVNCVLLFIVLIFVLFFSNKQSDNFNDFVEQSPDPYCNNSNPCNLYDKDTNMIKWNNDSFNIYFTEVYPNFRGIGIKSLPIFLLKELYNKILNVEFSDHMLLNMIQKAIDDNQEDKQKMIKEIKLFDSSRNQKFENYLHPRLVQWLQS